MSWMQVNELLSLAAVDQDFCRKLLMEPLAAIQQYGFQLTEHEQHVICQIRTNDLAAFSQYIMEQLAEDHT